MFQIQCHPGKLSSRLFFHSTYLTRTARVSRRSNAFLNLQELVDGLWALIFAKQYIFISNNTNEEEASLVSLLLDQEQIANY